MPRRFLYIATAVLLGTVGILRAVEPSRGSTTTPSSATDSSRTPTHESLNAPAGAPTTPDPSYHLTPGDTIQVSVYEEPDLSAMQTIAHSGEIRLPLIGDIILGGKSVRDAEKWIESTYIK